MARILVAAVGRTVAGDLKALLQDARFEVCEAGDGQETFRRYQLERPDLVLLDADLTGLDGADVVRRIRREDSDTGIVLFSARSDELTRTLGLELGADDYVARPFGRHELIARLNAVLRRRDVSRRRPGADGTAFDLGTWRVNGRELAVHAPDGGRIDLTPREYALLRYFSAHPNEVARRADLFDYAWGRGAYVFSRTLDTHVCTLRRKIAGSGWRIETVSGMGYRLRTADSAA